MPAVCGNKVGNCSDQNSKKLQNCLIKINELKDAEIFQSSRELQI